jgi:hypothetical protein
MLQKTVRVLQDVAAVKAPALPDLSGAVRSAATAAAEARAEGEKAREAVAAAAAGVEAKRGDVERLAVAIRGLEAKVAGAPPSVPRQFRVPQLHPATPEAVFNCVLKGGRFYAVRPPGKGFDTDDVQVSEGDDGTFAVTVRAEAGTPVGEDPKAAAGKLAAALALDPTGVLIEFSVYPDSFREFILAKQWFVDRGFSYNWKPHPAGQPLLYARAVGIEEQ